MVFGESLYPSISSPLFIQYAPCTVISGCLRRCGMNSSDDDLVPYEKAPREIPRLATTSSPLSPPINIAPPLFSPCTHTPHRKITIMDNDSFVPLLCSTKIVGATGHHRSISLLGAEGSFHDMVLHDRCRSLNHLDDRPSDGRLLRHDHYSTEKFMSTSIIVMIDPSKIAGDRTREVSDLVPSFGRKGLQSKEDTVEVSSPIPLEPVISVTRGPLPI
ncbi:hypothetical protein PRIPAC_84498, partial [Pristionchus pacificus]|uniref:Uncharacterized protein n=1 Tax=Pristionchus pacificus TaxID=54126 RepID=A0A2A6CID4_PRIPA